MTPLITHESLENAMNYPTYVEMVRRLFGRGETTGNKEFQTRFWMDLTAQSLEKIDSLLQFSNLKENTIKKIQSQDMPLVWLAITQAWCINSAYILPVIYKMAELNSNITMKVVLRDEPPYIIDNFLTRGSKSTPKVICLDAESLVVLGTWGPRPTELQAKMMLRTRAINKLFGSDSNAESKGRAIVNQMTEWYEKDQTESIQIEVLESLIY